MKQAKVDGIAPLHKATRAAETQLPRSKEATNIFGDWSDCLKHSAAQENGQ
jgi:hypothetical protein